MSRLVLFSKLEDFIVLCGGIDIKEIMYFKMGEIFLSC
jgi:hypothetical protein